MLDPIERLQGATIRSVNGIEHDNADIIAGDDPSQ